MLLEAITFVSLIVFVLIWLWGFARSRVPGKMNLDYLVPFSLGLGGTVYVFIELSNSFVVRFALLERMKDEGFQVAIIPLLLLCAIALNGTLDFLMSFFEKSKEITSSSSSYRAGENARTLRLEERVFKGVIVLALTIALSLVVLAIFK